MLVSTLEALCNDCIKLGLASSKADFARSFMRRFDRYMALARARGGWVPFGAGHCLVTSLEAVRDHCPPSVAADIEAIIDKAEEGIMVARMFRR